ncbi:MAG: carboxy terminal-processing peptidase [Sulfuritalea sp.]|nr:carboxy terminal-processing peptidase [Sulfuritalea sp.]
MSKKLWWIILALTMAGQAASFDAAKLPGAELKPEQQQAQVAHLAASLIARHHYQALLLDDAMSEKIFDRYLKALDSEKLFFVQTDIDQLAGIRTRLDDAIIDEDLDVFFFIFNFYAQRVAERIAYARGLLGEGFDFSQKESYQYEREREAWPKSDEAVRDLWRKRVKNDWLRLKLAGMDDKSIATTLDKRYDNFLKRISRLRSEDVFQTLMNAYTMGIEPHTTYKGPRAAEESGILMKLSMVGIGTVLTEKDGYITVRELVPGGPSALSGRLKIGDRIIGVAQRESDAITDVQGWRMDDIVALIRGAADTAVLLNVLPADAGADGKHQLISLTRKKIALEEQYARKTIVPVADGKATRRIGVISLPSFYHDFEGRQSGDRNFRSAAQDVARLLGELKTEKVDSVLIDLRNNGGGSLTEAIELTGLFVGRGPVVQQRDATGEVTVERGSRSGLAWGGPLGVLINRGSASASEIFAAAIQDYGRGLVIGETSYGKGTVQAVFNLDQVGKTGQPKLGQLVLTIAQFFRIDGGSTQLRGVKPDILLPGAFDNESFGESSLDSPLPWSQIKAANYSSTGKLKSLLPSLVMRHEARVTIDKDFGYLQEDIAEFRLQRAKNRVSLNEAERRMERAALEARLIARKASRQAGNGANDADVNAKPATKLLDDGLQADERKLANELAAENANKTAKDIWLTEAVHILSDEAGLLKLSSAWLPLSSRTRH